MLQNIRHFALAKVFWPTKHYSKKSFKIAGGQICWTPLIADNDPCIWWDVYNTISLFGNVQISLWRFKGEKVCSNRQSTMIWGWGFGQIVI